MSKSNVILAIFLVIAVVYLGWAVYAAYFMKNEEHFTDGKLTDYEARMAVMKVFDTVLHRKPLPDEIDKYAKVTNEQDMLIAVMTDYNVTTPPPSAITTTETPATATVATVGTVVVPPVTTNGATTAAVAVAVAPVTSPSASTGVVPAKSEGFGQAPANSNSNSSRKTTNSNGAASPDANPVIDLKSIETNLSTIVDTVNSIRALLYTQTMCEQ